MLQSKAVPGWCYCTCHWEICAPKQRPASARHLIYIAFRRWGWHPTHSSLTVLARYEPAMAPPGLL